MKNFSLEGKVAVITGAGSGLGYATARRFHDAGAMVTMADINENTTAAAEEIGCFFVRTDVSKEADVENLMKTASEHYGPLDIVINNAGIICGEELLENADAATYESLFHVNVMGAVFGIKYGQKYMRDGGIILNTASNSANGDYAGYGPYIMSKISVVGITKVAAIELAPECQGQLHMSQHHRHAYGIRRRLRNRTAGHGYPDAAGKNVQAGRSGSTLSFPGSR